MGSDIFERLRSVPVSRRPIPFWSWNDKLESGELRRQIREMAASGLGGFFMHARGGLETEYLSDEWMNLVEACLAEGGAQGLDVWLYDEEGWPSGFAGGRVPAKGEEYFGRWLTVERDITDPDSAAAHVGFLSLYRVHPDGAYERLPAPSSAATGSGGELVAVHQQSTPYYIDVLDPDVVRAFIEETHARYLHRFPASIGTEAGKAAISGFFTDEPRFSGSIDRDPPWSLKFPERFRAAYGYDILDHLAALFLPLEGCQKVRYDFYALSSRLFVDSFTKQIGEWCRGHGLELTGHLMMEESVFVQSANTAGVMPHYEHMDVPGVDWLRRPIGSPIVPKQVGSVAAQLGKKRVLTESFALAGWDVSFEELKRIVEWQYVNGVNLLCQHLEAYSLRGFRKRDYPPSMFFQQPWWSEYRLFNEYVARLGMLLSEGEGAARILVLHPMRSGWTLYDGTEYTAEFRALDKDFVSLCQTLSDSHLEYHFGDETIMAAHGSVESDAYGPRLNIGRCSYEAIVLPSLRCVASTTLNLLEAFIAAGGPVYAAGEVPNLVDGVVSSRLTALLEKVEMPAGGVESVPAALRGRLGGFPSVSDEDGEISGIHLTERRFGSTRVWFMVNLDQDRGHDARIRLPSRGRLRLYRGEDGSFAECPHEIDGECAAAPLHFEPMRSRILVLDPETNGFSAQAPREGLGAGVSDVVLGVDGEWNIESVDLNSLTLDSCAYRVDGGDLMDEKPIIHLMRDLLALRRPANIELRFAFRSSIGGGELSTFFLALERADEFEIEVNGESVPYVDIGWWKDSSFKKVDLHPLLKKGENEIVLRRRFFQRPKVYEVLFGEDVYETEKNKLTYDVELESMYLVGDFAVRSGSPFTAGERDSIHTEGPFSLERLPSRVSSGDLSVQGFPFFSGRIALSRDIDIVDAGSRVLFSMGKPRAVLSAVDLNGARAAVLPWAPWEVDLTPFVKSGWNRLTVILWSGNRNLLGPHHHILGEPYNVGPDSFTGRWSWVEKATEAEPAGDEERRRNYWKDGYSFVTFGVTRR